MRNAFIDELTSLAEKNENIFLVVGDLGWSVIEPFADKFPERFLNVGVAEQNMMSLSAGLASEGYHVFVYSIANFPTFRCAEQIRNDVDYHAFPVTIVTVGGGVAYGNLGYSHHAVQDYSLIRSMPNMLIAAPGDPLEVRSCLRYIVDNPQPSYLRLGKAGEPNIHKKEPIVEPGEWLQICPPSDKENGAIFLTTGSTLNLAISERSKPSFSDYGVYSVPLWGMKYKCKQLSKIKEFKNLIPIEDHLLDGGFTSWLLESSVGQKDVLEKFCPRFLTAEACQNVAKAETLWNFGLTGKQK